MAGRRAAFPSGLAVSGGAPPGAAVRAAARTVSGQSGSGRPRRAASAAVLLLLSGLLAVAFLGNLFVGAADLSTREVLAALAGGGGETARVIVRELRLPRALVAALLGGGLALAGAVLQALLRNPLAEPYILGVSGGAALGAVAALVLGLASANALALPLAALVGAVGAVLLVFRIAAAAGRALDTRVLLLAGVVVGAFFNAAILLLLSFAEADTFRSAMLWIMGSLSGSSWATVGVLVLYLVPACAALLALARPLDLLALGEEAAWHLGARVERVKVAASFITSLLVAAAVSVSGIIGFIGLVVPHAVRLLWGSGHRLLLPASLLGGAAFLLAADVVARTVVAPSELP
ncbi:MAG TPA: iron ABC transporter permease, partial [Longimicrobiales bacterium]|nr:iron ABC transporter permease [Longimicrobiales bacterium]